MGIGSITEYMDVGQLVIWAFWFFFAALVYYLRMEDKREGYPLEADLPDASGKIGLRAFDFPPIPAPKTFLLADGGTVTVPNDKRDTRPIAAKPVAPWPGAPLHPTGNPMLDAVGPASYTERADVPDLTIEKEPKVVPMRSAKGFSIHPKDPNPIGMTVVGADGEVGGKVADVWVDRSEPQIRYLEVELSGGGRRLLPIYLARVNARGKKVTVESIMGNQFANVPRTKSGGSITRREEDRISAYYAGGTLYAKPIRTESWL